MSGRPKRNIKPTTRSSASSAKKQKQSEDGDKVFTDHEMEYVLKELAQETLLRVVESNHRLVPVACRFVRSRYLDSYFEISNKMEPKSIAFLKLFGTVIKSLKLVYDDEYNRFDGNIEKIIFDCCNSPYVLCLMNANRFSMFNIGKPFDNVTQVILNTGTISVVFSKISNWFPKLKTLNLIGIRLHSTPDDKIFGGKLCPQLENLEIRNLKSKDDGDFYMKEISVLVKQSPNIRNIEIHNQDNIDELLKTIAEMNSDLPNLCLSLSSSFKKPVGASEIHFKSLKSLEIVQFDKPLNISTDQIERLCIDCERFDEKWLTLFKNNRKNAHDINVTGRWLNDKVASEFVHSVRVLTNLRTTNMLAKLTATQLVDLVSKNRLFQSGKFRLSDEKRQKLIFDSLMPDWKCVCYSGDIFHIEKKNGH